MENSALESKDKQWDARRALQTGKGLPDKVRKAQKAIGDPSSAPAAMNRTGWRRCGAAKMGRGKGDGGSGKCRFVWDFSA